jgi:hypothetical protein
MTPKEKAQELIRKYYRLGLHQDGQSLNWMEAKQCAMIAVDEIWAALESQRVFEQHGYWQEVKREIENL